MTPESLPTPTSPPPIAQGLALSSTPPSVARPALHRIAGLSLADFAKAGMILTVQSAALGRTVLFASDNAALRNGETRRVYRAADLERVLERGLGARGR